MDLVIYAYDILMTSRNEARISAMKAYLHQFFLMEDLWTPSYL